MGRGIFFQKHRLASRTWGAVVIYVIIYRYIWWREVEAARSAAAAARLAARSAALRARKKKSKIFKNQANPQRKLFGKNIPNILKLFGRNIPNILGFRGTGGRHPKSSNPQRKCSGFFSQTSWGSGEPPLLVGNPQMKPTRNVNCLGYFSVTSLGSEEGAVARLKVRPP